MNPPIELALSLSDAVIPRLHNLRHRMRWMRGEELLRNVTSIFRGSSHTNVIITPEPHKRNRSVMCVDSSRDEF